MSVQQDLSLAQAMRAWHNIALHPKQYPDYSKQASGVLDAQANAVARLEADNAALRERIEELEGLVRRKAVKCPMCDAGKRSAAPRPGETNPILVDCPTCGGAGWFWNSKEPSALAGPDTKPGSTADQRDERPCWAGGNIAGE